MKTSIFNWVLICILLFSVPTISHATNPINLDSKDVNIFNLSQYKKAKHSKRSNIKEFLLNIKNQTAEMLMPYWERSILFFLLGFALIIISILATIMSPILSLLILLACFTSIIIAFVYAIKSLILKEKGGQFLALMTAILSGIIGLFLLIGILLV